MPGPEIDSPQSLLNFLRNGGFEEWRSGTPPYWTLAGAGASVAVDATTYYVGSQCATLTRSGADATLTQNICGNAAALTYAQGKTFTFSARLRPGTGAKAIIGLDDGVSQVWTGYPTDTTAFTRVVVTMTISNAATKLEAVCKLQTADGSTRIDACMLTEGTAIPAFAPNPSDFFDQQNLDTTTPSTPTGLAATALTMAILLSWTANPEADINHYELQRATDAAFTTGVTTISIYATAYLDDVADTNTYYYRIRAIRISRAESAWTSGVSATATAPGASIIWFSTTDVLLGRQSAGAGTGEEIPCTASGRAILDDSSAGAQRTTLGLGTGDSPQFTGLTLSSLPGPLLVSTDASGNAGVVSDLSAWIAGTATQITVTDDGDGTITLSTPPGAYLQSKIVTDATYTLTVSDDVVYGNSASGQTFTYPISTGSGKVFYVKQLGVGAVTVSGDGADTIDGLGTQTLAQWETIQVQDGAAGAYYIL